MSESYWEEIGSFSLFLGNIPHNILLSSEELNIEGDGKKGVNSFHENKNGRSNHFEAKKGKYGVKNMLPTNSYIKDYFNVARKKKSDSNNTIRVGNGGSPDSNSDCAKNANDHTRNGTSKTGNGCLLNTGLTRNDLEERLANKIQELRKKGMNKNSKKDEFEFGRIKLKDENINKNHYLEKKDSKIKKINKALLDIKREEEMLSKLPEEERESKMRQIAMSKAIKKAQGIKVKDSKSKLIKSKKRIQAKKKKSKKRWDEIKRNNKQL
ncbi:hypothetical protein RS030_172571 [Cryptosporidium xiaoi]|uniref:Ribosomal RNA-processing protein 14/surfeit locus protein 6 C-terminal domain-containing protein n=1 Tax=Cryptosporidium xiaoi TaxID=659607 RepID=A0AAV9XZW2_9CRYT